MPGSKRGYEDSNNERESTQRSRTSYIDDASHRELLGQGSGRSSQSRPDSASLQSPRLPSGLVLPPDSYRQQLLQQQLQLRLEHEARLGSLVGQSSSLTAAGLPFATNANRDNVQLPVGVVPLQSPWLSHTGQPFLLHAAAAAYPAGSRPPPPPPPQPLEGTATAAAGGAVSKAPKEHLSDRQGTKKRKPTQNSPPDPSEPSKDIALSDLVREETAWEAIDMSQKSSVSFAASLVGQELQEGDWPTPIQLSDDDVEPISVPGHHANTHMTLIAAALEDFALRVVLPALRRRGHQPNPASKDPPEMLLGGATSLSQIPRSFFATILALREVLIQNAYQIFGVDTFGKSIPDMEPDGSSTSSTQQDRIEDWCFLARNLATGVIVGALERGFEESIAPAVVDYFLSTAQSYDGGSVNFSPGVLSCLQPSSTGVLENGRKLQDDEDVARAVSFGIIQKRHPLFPHQTADKGEDDAAKSRIPVPETTACLVSMIERVKQNPTIH